MARQEVSRTTHIEEGELRVTHENAILTNITKRIKLLTEVATDLDDCKVFYRKVAIAYTLTWCK